MQRTGSGPTETHGAHHAVSWASLCKSPHDDGSARAIGAFGASWSRLRTATGNLGWSRQACSVGFYLAYEVKCGGKASALH